MNFKWTRPLIAGVIALGATTGCAEEREPINRVQANALQKSFFVGADLASDSDNPKFYANGTLLDIGYGAKQDGIFSAFYGNDLSIIRWEITEHQLLGRLAYERIDDTDGKGAGLENNDGQVVYAFHIDKHFDVQRSYNPSTGEELNVIEENTSDRVWNQRQFMRVDWSQNLITDAYDFDTLAQYGAIFGAYDWQSVNYYINDPKHEHAPNFEDGNYFDVTTRAYATPAQLDLGGLFGLESLPACFLDADFSGGSSPDGNCNPVEVTIRHSFWQVEDNDYEPADWDGYRFQAAGAFTKDRYGFARNYGMVDDRWRRFISRYNIWQRSHFYSDPEAMTGAVECNTAETTGIGGDATRDDNDNGTHDECEAVGKGSRCDIHMQKCTLPYVDREVRPIVWYYTNKSDPRFYRATEWATQEWDVAMRGAVLAAQNSECKRAGGENCDGRFTVIKGQMTMQTDALALWREIDACRAAKTGEGRWDTSSCLGGVGQFLTSRGYEAGTEDYAAIERLVSFQNDTVVLCHSPVAAEDHPACAPGKPRLPAGFDWATCQGQGLDAAEQATCDAAYKVRIGDVRHHLVNVIHSPETPSPWGFGPTFASPLTGEAISASINVWSYPTDLISQSTVDISRFIAGELSPEDVTEGKYVKDYARAAELAGNGTALPPMTRAQMDSHRDSMFRAAGRDLVTGKAAELGKTTGVPVMDSKTLALAQRIKGLRNVRAEATVSSTSKQTYFARMQQAYGTVTEAALMGPGMQKLAGTTKLPVGVSAEFASPLRGRINPTLYRDLQQYKELGFAERGSCLLSADDFAPTPTSALGLSKLLQEKFGDFDGSQGIELQLERAEKMRGYLADRMHYAVIIHEMGHTFGYRHNFVSSSGAFNYRPQYWQLRTKNGTVTTECDDLAQGDAAADCVGPRYFDPLTAEEQDGMINTWTHSSVMDYAGDITQDLLGLGAYDFHAARMFYGDVATVFSGGDMKETEPLAIAIHETIQDSFGGILGYGYQNAPSDLQNGNNNSIHYSSLNRDYGLINGCTNIDQASFKPSYWDDEKDGAWHPTLDGHLVKVNGEFSRCFQRRVDFVDWDDLGQLGDDPDNPGSIQNDGRIGPSVDAAGRTRVPYGFATDRWADLGNLAVFRHDSGADVYELFEFLISEQELKHIFDNYRRNRQTFSVRGAANRVLGRYNEKMRDGAKGMTLIFNNLANFALGQNAEPNSFFAAYSNLFGWNDNMLAAAMAFDHFTRQMQRPNAGPHTDPSAGSIGGFRNAMLALEADENSDPGAADLVVSNGPQGFYNSVGIGGKPVGNFLADDQGEYDSSFTINAGSYYDKVYSTMLLTESVDNFISDGRDDFVDARYRAVSLADLFPDGYRRWLVNNLTNDEWIKGARVLADGNNVPDIGEGNYPKQPLGWTSWWTDTPQTCFPADGTMICTAPYAEGNPFLADSPASMRAIDSSVGWEEQKFLIAWTLVYLPSNASQTWLDMMGIWSLGDDTDPGFQNRIELHMPTGDTYIARTYGSEDFCFGTGSGGAPLCKNVQRGIGARVLEYANEMLEDAYVTNEITQNGVTWYEPVIGPEGAPIVKYTATQFLTPGFTLGSSPPDCQPDPDPSDSDYSSFSGCRCEYNSACVRLNRYVSLPDFLRQAMRDFGMADPSMKGIY